MYDFYYETLLKDSKKFGTAGSLQNTIVELCDSEENGLSHTQLNHRLVDETKLLQWLHRSCDDEPSRRLQLIMGKPEEHNNDTEILPLSMSSGTFEEIQSVWSFPSELLRTMLSITPVAMEFETETHLGTTQFACARWNIGHELQRLANPCPVPGLMLRSARSRDCSFSLALFYNRGTGSVSGLLHGLQEHEVRILLSSLHKSVDVVEDPLLLPLILIEMNINFFALLLEKHASALEVLEESTGMRHFNTQSEETEEQKTARMQNLSFSDITQKLTGIAGMLAFCEWTFESCVKGLSVSRTWRSKLIDHSTNSETGCRWKACPSIERHMAYIKSLAAGAGAHGRLLEARRAAQVQTIYSLIGQRDNRLNQNMAMDSQRIAVHAQRDSTDMRIIAWATLVFLPGTFTATLFSSTFFDFLPDDDNPRIVSWWLWLYFLATVLFTGLVFLGWYHFSRTSRVRSQEGMENLKKFGTRGV